MSAPTTKSGPRKRIFMTGASGYIGSRVTEFAIAEGYEVYGLSRSETSDAKIKNNGGIPVRGNHSSLDVLRRESAQADIVIHLVDTWLDNLDKDYDIVVRNDAAIVNAIADSLQGTNKPLIVTSGIIVAPDPNGTETNEDSPLEKNPLNGRFKSEQHALGLRHRGVNVRCIRVAPWVYGRGGSGIRLFMQMFAPKGEVIYIGDGGTKRTSVAHVDDTARLYLLVAQDKQAEAGEVYNATSATDVTFRQLSEAMGAVLELPVREITFEEAKEMLPEVLAKFLSWETRGSSDKARAKLGWRSREVGILEDVRKGSYVAVAEELKKVSV